MSKVAIVTGGARGIGAAISKLAAARGYAVCVNYQSNASAAEEVVGEIKAQGGRAVGIQADVSKAGDVSRLFIESARALGEVTALVNNAGITGRISRLDETDAETMQQTIDINVMGVMLCSREAVVRMSSKHGGAGGGIVSISSGAATLGSPGEFVWYAASKGAVDSFTLGLSKEVTGEGIRVNAVSPGLTETELHASGGEPGRVARLESVVPIGRAATPEEVAQAALWLLSEEASYVSGAILRCAGGR